MQLLNVDDNKGDLWVVLKDAGFEDNVNVVLSVDQVQELHSLLSHWLQDYVLTELAMEDAKEILSDTRLEDKDYEC